MATSWSNSATRSVVDSDPSQALPLPSPHPILHRWNGAARSCSDWDHLRKDPELWYRKGNCSVYLYAKGESQRGPSFKVHFSDLVKANCYPLIDRFVDWEAIGSPQDRKHAINTPRMLSMPVDLFIPAPSTADRAQAFQYHVATRNFFAWVCRRSLVGKSLGSAFVALLRSMHEFRSDVDDNVTDMMAYFDEEGYLVMTNQPNHALALLYFADLFQMEHLYKHAFCHCVGMSDLLLDSTEYQFITPESQDLIRQYRTEMETRLRQCCNMLSTFLEGELSPACLVTEGSRAHLERFRNFLLSFYQSKNFYPPYSSDPACDFDPAVLFSMKDDFEALYHLLVDDKATLSQGPPISKGYSRICNVQLIRDFDMRHDFKTLQRPRTLLPQPPEPSHRVPWLRSLGKLRSDYRLTAHASLVKASNIMKPGVVQNPLVRAYRTFEEDCVLSPSKSDRQEKVSLTDGRIIRWAVVYATYQILRRVTETPTIVLEDLGKARYHLSVSSTSILPWEKTIETERVPRRQTELFKSPSNMLAYDGSPNLESPGKIEIKPDIDYFALMHKEPPPVERSNSVLVVSERQDSFPLRSKSLSRALSRSHTFRRSLRLFKTASSTTPPQTATTQSRAAYHEIVVHGYGNGTNDVNLNKHGQSIDTNIWPSRSTSNASKSDDCGGLTPVSLDSTVETVDTQSINTPLPLSFTIENLLPDLEAEKRSRSLKRREVVSMITRPVSGRVPKRRPVTAIFPEGLKYTDDAVERQSTPPRPKSSAGLSNTGSPIPPVPPLPPSIARSLTRRSMVLTDLKSKSPRFNRRSSMPAKMFQKAKESKQQGADGEYGEEPTGSDEDYWTKMHQFMDPNLQLKTIDDDGETTHAWEQYEDLGGLTEPKPRTQIK